MIVIIPAAPLRCDVVLKYQIMNTLGHRPTQNQGQTTVLLPDSQRITSHKRRIPLFSSAKKRLWEGLWVELSSLFTPFYPCFTPIIGNSRL